jgi:nitroreductase
MIEQLKWRYATKQYDKTKKISSENLELLKQATQLAPTSYGLQAYRLINVESAELREKLKEKSYGQPQITDASNLFVLVTLDSPNNDTIDAYIGRISETRNVPVEALQGFSDYMKGSISHLSDDQKKVWSQKQAYIGLGFLLAEAAFLKIDSTPMEGFEPAAYGELLNLKGETATLVIALGYRSEEDQTQHGAKVRKSLDQFVETV